MKKLFLLFLVFIMFSCFKSDIVQYSSANTEPAKDASGLQYNGLDPNRLSFCNPGGLGRKFCRFLAKHNTTIWADTENYYSDFSDIKFSNDVYFISFFNIENNTSYCKGWKPGENIQDGIKWNIKLKKDEEDVFWFDYEYYGLSNEIEYSITYKYEVIDSLLHFSNTEDETFIFHPSEKNYSKDFLDTEEIIELEGCMFY